MNQELYSVKCPNGSCFPHAPSHYEKDGTRLSKKEYVSRYYSHLMPSLSNVNPEKDVVNVDGVLLCVMCDKNNANVVFTSCLHIYMCLDCVKQISQYKYRPFICYESGEKLVSKVREFMGEKRGKIYIIISAGMGCSVYAKRNNPEEEPKIFVMHGDSWGQYDIEVASYLNNEPSKLDKYDDFDECNEVYTEIKELNKFIDGFCLYQKLD